RRPPRSTHSISSAASFVYKTQALMHKVTHIIEHYFLGIKMHQVCGHFYGKLTIFVTLKTHGLNRRQKNIFPSGDDVEWEQMHRHPERKQCCLGGLVLSNGSLCLLEFCV
ncbi:hypothetical protein, partial [Raoultella planticola]|uniref:hypothetical protein n=1 Tax=Raoultella planticola TaxID=575 RepID=UPI001F44F1EB